MHHHPIRLASDDALPTTRLTNVFEDARAEIESVGTTYRPFLETKFVNCADEGGSRFAE
jgi:hypothetical protein